MAKAKTKSKSVKRAGSVAQSQTKAKIRVLEKPHYRSFQLHKRIKHPAQPLPGAFRLLRSSVQHILQHKRLFFGICVVFFILNLIFVTGLFGTVDFSDMKLKLHEIFQGNISGQFTTGLALFGILIGSATGSSSQAGSVYQMITMLLMSLAIIWALRQTYAGEKVTIKQALYKSTHPLIPFILVFVVLGIQLIPIIIGGTIYSIVLGQGLAPTLVENILWFLFLCCFMLLSLYMISSSMFALYVVTLPDMTPMKALRSARELVRYRRWSIMRKVFLVPVIAILFLAVVMIPTLLYLTPVAEWIFGFVSLFLVAVIHAYAYRLYRELL